MSTPASSGTRDLARTQEDILRVATQHFAKVGYYGARVDEIAAETSTTKRMIYYCFGSKDALFTACLERAYADIRAFENDLHLADLDPVDAVATYVAETIRYHEAHPELALLIRTENVLEGEHLAADGAVGAASGIVGVLDAVLERGRASGAFRSDATGVELHLIVSALANYRITNETTIGLLFGYPMRDAARLGHDIDQYRALVLAWLTSPAPAVRRSDITVDIVRPPAEVSVLPTGDPAVRIHLS